MRTQMRSTVLQARCAMTLARAERRQNPPRSRAGRCTGEAGPRKPSSRSRSPSSQPSCCWPLSPSDPLVARICRHLRQCRHAGPTGQDGVRGRMAVRRAEGPCPHGGCGRVLRRADAVVNDVVKPAVAHGRRIRLHAAWEHFAPTTSSTCGDDAELDRVSSALLNCCLVANTPSRFKTPFQQCVGGLLQTDPQERAKTTTASSGCRPRPFQHKLCCVWALRGRDRACTYQRASSPSTTGE